jgi:hypothetical protein
VAATPRLGGPAAPTTEVAPAPKTAPLIRTALTTSNRVTLRTDASSIAARKTATACPLAASAAGRRSVTGPRPPSASSTRIACEVDPGPLNPRRVRGRTLCPPPSPKGVRCVWARSTTRDGAQVRQHGQDAGTVISGRLEAGPEKDRRGVCRRSAFGHHEPLGDCRVGSTLRHEAKHPAFATD